MTISVVVCVARLSQGVSRNVSKIEDMLAVPVALNCAVIVVSRVVGAFVMLTVTFPSRQNTVFCDTKALMYKGASSSKTVNELHVDGKSVINAA